MAAADYYKQLGIREDADAAAVKRAYRRLCLKTHPDLFQGDAKESAKAEFLKVQEAYNVLHDPEKRARYDRYRHHPQGTFHADNTGAAADYRDLQDILNTLNDMQMPPPYTDLARFPEKFRAVIRRMLTQTGDFREQIIEIQRCVVHDIGLLGQSSGNAVMVVTNIRLLICYENQRGDIIGSGAVLGDINAIKIRESEQRGGAQLTVRLARETMRLALPQSRIMRSAIVFDLYQIPVTTVTRPPETSFYGVPTIIYGFFLLIFAYVLFGRLTLPQETPTALLIWLGFAAAIYWPVLDRRCRHARFERFSESVIRPLVLIIAVFAGSVCLLIGGHDYLKRVRHSCYLHYEHKTVSLRYGLAGGRLYRSNIPLAKIRMNLNRFHHRFHPFLKDGYQLKDWRQSSYDREAVQTVLRYVKEPGPRRRLRHTMERALRRLLPGNDFSGKLGDDPQPNPE